MKVINEELWRTQCAELGLMIARHPEIDWLSRYPALVVRWADLAEQILEDENAPVGTAAEALRRTLRAAEQETNLRIGIQLLAQTILMYCVHWHYRDALFESLNTLELRLIEDVSTRDIELMRHESNEYMAKTGDGGD